MQGSTNCNHIFGHIGLIPKGARVYILNIQNSSCSEHFLALDESNLVGFECDQSGEVSRQWGWFGFSFAFDAPTVWNSLPEDISASPTIASFRKKLKTYLYAKAYPP